MNERIHSISIESPQSPHSIERDRLRAALALGAGGALGCAHIGVILALQELGVEIDAVAGSSMGALVGAFLAEGKLVQLESFLKRTNIRTMLGYLDFSRTSSGLVSSEKLDVLLRDELGDVSIENMKMPYTAMAMEWGTWKSIPLDRGDLVKAIVISSSVPFVFNRKQHEGRTLVDGGFSNLVPLSAARKLSDEKLIAVGVARGFPIVQWGRRMLAELQWNGHRPDVDLFLNLTDGGAVRYDKAQKFIDAGYKFVMDNRGYILGALSGS